ncbi:hypothetical protein [Glutamicibacter arilaitensis]|uniref:hypothetical protein n=1 Tax=Glutamicibacter arilaitensis TaxID=256701 RepID=UPI003A957098
MPSDKRRKSATALFLGAAIFIIVGIAVLWWEGQQGVILYSGSYVPLVEDSEIYFGPGPTEILGWVLALLGVGALGVASGLSLRQLARFKAWFLIAGLLLAAGGIAALVWDYNQVRTFGWFAYAPLSEAEFAPASIASVMGKLGLVAGTLLASSYLGFRYHSKPSGSAFRG